MHRAMWLKSDSDLQINFAGVPGTQIILNNFAIKNLENLRQETESSVQSCGKVILWNLNLDLGCEALLARGCDWAMDYLRNSANVKEEDKNLCDRIGTTNITDHD